MERVWCYSDYILCPTEAREDVIIELTGHPAFVSCIHCQRHLVDEGLRARVGYVVHRRDDGTRETPGA